MQPGDQKRRDPLAGLGSGEPAEDLGLTPTPLALQRRPTPGGRKTPPRPTEIRRKARKVTVTFSPGNEDVKDRLRALAKRWGLWSNTRAPNVSAVVEYLLLPQLEQAEQGRINGPGVPE